MRHIGISVQGRSLKMTILASGTANGAVSILHAMGTGKDVLFQLNSRHSLIFTMSPKQF